MKITIPFRSKLGDLGVTSLEAPPLRTMTLAPTATPPSSEEPKCINVLPAKFALYLYTAMFAFFAALSVLQGNAVFGIGCLAVLGVEAFGVFRDEQHILLASFGLQFIGLALYACLTVFVLLVYTVASFTDTPSANWETRRMRDKTWQVGVLVIVLVMIIHRWMLTWQVYQHSKSKTTPKPQATGSEMVVVPEFIVVPATATLSNNVV